MMLIVKYKNDPHYKFSFAYGATPWNMLITVSLYVASGILWHFDNVTLAIAGLCFGTLMLVICVINSAGDFLREKSVRQPAKLSRMLSRFDWLTPVREQVNSRPEKSPEFMSNTLGRFPRSPGSSGVLRGR